MNEIIYLMSVLTNESKAYGCINILIQMDGWIDKNKYFSISVILVIYCSYSYSIYLLLYFYLHFKKLLLVYFNFAS